MENGSLVLVILGSLLVGALLPVLFLLAATLSTARRQIIESGRRFDGLSEQVQLVVGRVEKATRALEGGDVVLNSMLRTMTELTRTLEQIRRGLGIAAALGSAVGPAATAFAQGLRTRQEARGDHNSGDTGESCEEPGEKGDRNE